MNSIDTLLMSLRNLWRRKLRTVLTILGVMIGCASIVVMLSLGLGMKAATNRQLEEMGSIDIITIVPYPMYNQENNQQKEANPLNDKAVNEIRKIENVKAVMPMLEVEQGSVQLVSKKYSNWAMIYGVDPEQLEFFEFAPEWGRLLTAEDSNAIMFGKETSNGWYNPMARNNRWSPDQESPIDLKKDKIEFQLGRYYVDNQPKFAKSFKVNPICVLESDNYEISGNAYVTLEFAEQINKEAKRLSDKNKAEGGYDGGFNRNRKSKYSSILVRANDMKDVKGILEVLEKEGYNARSNLQFIEPMIKASETQQKILGGIGAVAFLVAAIGIANTMVMSIYERVKEIGIMKVIGASIKDIRRIFLSEAALIGFFGGIVGVGLSLIVSNIINSYAAKGGSIGSMGMMGPMMGPGGEEVKISLIPIWLILVAIAFSTIVGLISGYYPASKATKLSALEAIRTQ